MKLSTSAIEKLKGNTRLKNLLALSANKSIYTIEKWIKENETNGDLTKASLLKIIKVETELSEEQILEEEEAELQR
jgi:hypothetical protein